MQELFILNGPNLNLLGVREPEIYGYTGLADVEQWCSARCLAAGVKLVFRQSNHEGALIDSIHEAVRLQQQGLMAGLIINAGAYTHSSVALHDALKALNCPKIELHISNTFAREAFRHHSYISPAVDAVIAGLGVAGYVLAVDAITDKMAC
ncbi:MAG: type II 3-dehydroquinate dehydratase [Brachymonas sp.]|jgi:3-dehydroquinate dehydratase-2